MTHFKAVQVTSDGRILPCVHPRIGLEYKVGEWTKPLFPGSSIFCCRDLEHARFWAKGWTCHDFRTVVYSCEVEIEPNPIFLATHSASTVFILSKWQTLSIKELQLINEYEPRDKDMVFCKRIKLLEKVE